MKSLIVMILLMVGLAACATSSLKAPCPDYGKYCHKVPINSWNYQNR